MKKLILSLIAAAFILTLNVKYTFADDFDFNYYAQRYPDVVNTVGYSEKALHDHYMTKGQKEGRFPNALAECSAMERYVNGQVDPVTGKVTPLPEPTPTTATPAAPAAASTPAAASVPTPVANSYVDVDITNQTMTLFQNNLPVLQSPCVTGTPKNGRSTPTGVWYVMEKTPGKRLKGDTWDVWVDRWMRFTPDSCGLHDASWRRKFGGNIYLSNGSHGCVNLPKNIAYTLFDLVSVGTPVIVH